MSITASKILKDADFCKLRITVRRTARRVTMRVKPDGLYVVTPPYASLDGLLEQIRPYRPKLLEAYRRIARKPFDWNFTIQAECFRLQLAKGKGMRFQVKIEEELVTISCPDNADMADVRVQALLRRAVARALQKRAEAYLPQVVSFWSARFGLPYNKVKVTKARSRWGSCSFQKNICLSYNLMLLPVHLMDYVILHELAHTREMNHGSRFWALLDQLTDGKALALRKELNSYSPTY